MPVYANNNSEYHNMIYIRKLNLEFTWQNIKILLKLFP